MTFWAAGMWFTYEFCGYRNKGFWKGVLLLIEWPFVLAEEINRRSSRP